MGQKKGQGAQKGETASAFVVATGGKSQMEGLTRAPKGPH